jgi:aminoglycoside phosphotransferase (APT) family kinase protein
MATDRGAGQSGVDLDRLDAFVARALGSAAPLERRLLSGGLSQTTLRYDRADGGPSAIVRIPPVEGPLEPYSAEVEAAVLSELAQSGQSVPPVLFVDDGADVVGRPFLATALVAGEVVQDGAAGVPDARRTAMGAAYLDALVRIHRLPTDDAAAWTRLQAALAGWPRKTPTGVLERWEQGLAGLTIPTYHAFIGAWLRRRMPTDPASTLVHGDYRLANMLWSAEGRITAVLDWEEAAVGDAYSDLAWTLMGTANDADLVMGVLPRHAFLTGYAQRTGEAIDEQRLAWWEIAAGWAKLCMETRAIAMIAKGTYLDLRPLLWGYLNRRIAVPLLEKIERYEATRDAAGPVSAPAAG